MMNLRACCRKTCNTPFSLFPKPEKAGDFRAGFSAHPVKAGRNTGIKMNISGAPLANAACLC